MPRLIFPPCVYWRLLLLLFLATATSAFGQVGGSRQPFGTMAEGNLQRAPQGYIRIGGRIDFNRYKKYYKAQQKSRQRYNFSGARDDRYRYIVGHKARRKLNGHPNGKRVSYKRLNSYSRMMKQREEAQEATSFRSRPRGFNNLGRQLRFSVGPKQQICLPRVRIQRQNLDYACLPKIVIKHYSHDKQSCPTHNVKHRPSSNYAVYCDPGMRITSNMQRVAKDVKHFFTNHRKHCKINAVYSGLAVGQVLLDTVEYKPYFFLKKTVKVYKPIVYDFVVKKRVIQYYLHNERNLNRRKRKNRYYNGVKNMIILAPRKPNFLVTIGILNTFKRQKLSKEVTKKAMMQAMKDKLTKTHAALKERHPYINHPHNDQWEFKLKNMVRMYPEERENLEEIKLEIIAQDNVVVTDRASDKGDVKFIEIKKVPKPAE